MNNLHYYSYSLYLPQNQRTTRKRHDSSNPTTSMSNTQHDSSQHTICLHR